MRFKFLALLIGTSLSLPSVWAWGAAGTFHSFTHIHSRPTFIVLGHEIVATIAQIHLHPSVFPSLCTILNYSSPDPNLPQCHLAPVATWADKIKYKMRWSAALHYVNGADDHPPQNCAFPGARGWAGKPGRNILSAIRNVTNILEETDSSSDDLANEAVKFLVHFMGDLHQPLHLVGRGRGGNSQKVRFDGRITSMISHKITRFPQLTK
jgi:hypothetical protein